MAIRTGKELLESLRDDRALFIDGERVADVTTDPRFAGAARSLAELYDMQHDPALVERMTFRSPTSGERVGLSFIEPRSVDELIRRRDMVKIWMDASCGMFGRSPDFMNIFVTAFASAADEFGHKDKRFAENLRAYHAHIREHDICMTHTLVNPQVDRSKPVEKQDKDLAAKIVKETDAGIVIRGARMVSTLCAYANDLLVLPSTYLATSKEAEPYAFGFSVAGERAGSALHLPPFGDPPERRLAAGSSALGALRRDRCDGDLRRRAGAVGARLHPSRRRAVQRALQPHRHHAADHAPVLDQEPGEVRVHDGPRLRDREDDQHRSAPARPGHAGRADPVHRVLPRLPAGERSRCRAESLRRDDPGGDAAVDGAHDVPEDVRAHVRDHPDLGCRRARRGPLLCRARRAGGGRRDDLFPGGQRRRQDAHQIVPAGLRRRGLVLFGPPAALRALLFGRPGAARRHPLRPLRQGHPHRPDHRRCSTISKRASANAGRRWRRPARRTWRSADG